MDLAWLIPVLSFAAFPVVIAFGRFLPKKGAIIAIGAILAGFALFWVVTAGFLSAGAATPGCTVDHGAKSCGFVWEWFRVRDTAFSWGMIIDPLTIVMLGLDRGASRRHDHDRFAGHGREGAQIVFVNENETRSWCVWPSRAPPPCCRR